VLAAKPLGYEIINLGGGRNPISLLQMVGIIEKTLGKKATIMRYPEYSADIRDTWADINKAARLLDWHPEVTAEEGIQRTIRWHQHNEVWLRSINV
jgi:nucleoside-diphosphate-sugar epimerase